MGKSIVYKSKITQLLIKHIYDNYNIDFRDYNKASIERRILSFTKKNSITLDTDLSLILSDKAMLQKLIESISVTVTQLFRDPEVYKLLRQKVLPKLKCKDGIKVWHAGCATGEEAYSLAIVLHEEGFKNVEITATDINLKSLKLAKSGIYPNSEFKHCSKNYLKSGGLNDITDYYNTKYKSSIICKNLRESINFIAHNLTSDIVIGKFDIIVCRNVFIYFTKELQKRILHLFNNSLNLSGYLWLGSKENLFFIDKDKTFYEIESKSKIYQKLPSTVL